MHTNKNSITWQARVITNIEETPNPGNLKPYHHESQDSWLTGKTNTTHYKDPYDTHMDQKLGEELEM